MDDRNRDGENMEKQNNGKKRRFARQTTGFLLLLLLFAGITAAIACTPIFSIRSIVIQGNSYVSKEDICQIAGVKEQQNIFVITTTDIQQRLLHDLRIEQATVRRVLPSTLEIQVTERIPLATVACQYGFLDLEQNGMVLDAYKKLKAPTLPAITGVTVPDVYIGDRVEQEMVQKVLVFLAALDEEGRKQLSEVNIASAQHLIAYTTGGVQIRLGDVSKMEEKAAHTQAFLRELKTMKYPVEYIDFTYASPFIKFKKQEGK